MEPAQFPSSSQGPQFVLFAVEGQPSDALSVSGVITRDVRSPGPNQLSPSGSGDSPAKATHAEVPTPFPHE